MTIDLDASLLELHDRLCTSKHEEAYPASACIVLDDLRAAAAIGAEVEREECAGSLSVVAAGLGYRRSKEREATLAAVALIRARGKR